MLRLIVNADDLGLTPGCSAGIIRGFKQGIVSDTTLMINSPYALEAVSLMKANGLNQAGLHLNLSYGTPMAPVAEVPSLIDENGRFYRKVNKSIPLMNGAEIERELRLQLEKFLATGLKLTHIDSHHHAHAYPQVIDLAIRMALEQGVPLRHTAEVKEKIIAAGVKTTDYFSMDFYNEKATLENLQAIIGGYSEGVLEIMSHPGESEQLIMEVSSYNSARAKELAVLTSPEMKAFLQTKGVKLISFAEL